jgi:triosephosphate isomerase
MKKKYVVGNWKMNNGLAEIKTFASTFSNKPKFTCEAWIAPQAPYIAKAIDLLGPNIKIGAQNSSNHLNGAFTGETSSLALLDIGCHFVILGHSERRQLFAEDNSLLNQKVHVALKAGLKVIFCIGETLQERENDQTFKVVEKQLLSGLANLPLDKVGQILIAYEPIWAIGTGKTASTAQAEEVHAFIRKLLPKMNIPTNAPLLYGGSVKTDNFAELINSPNIDGGLIGGASLKAESFVQLCAIASI